MNTTTHIEVTAANRGAEVWGLKDGQLLEVINETACFFNAKTHAGKHIKISKKDGKACHWKQKASSPVFNV